MNANQLKTFKDKVIDAYDMEENEKLGRHGIATAKNAVLEVRRGINPPTISEVVGAQWNSKTKQIHYKTDELDFTQRLSNAGNGERTFKLYPGLFIVKNCLCSGYSLVDEKLIVSETSIVSVSNQNFSEDCREVYAADFDIADAEKQTYLINEAEKENMLAEKTKKASSILNEILAERAVTKNTIIDEFEVLPNFRETSLQNIISLLSQVKDEAEIDEYIALHTIPFSYSCNYEVGLSPEDVVEKIKTKQAEREKALADAELKSDELGLPVLSGTEKQVKWALQIRDKVVQSNPKDPRLKKAKTAKYWIDNR